MIIIVYRMICCELLYCWPLGCQNESASLAYQKGNIWLASRLWTGQTPTLHNQKACASFKPPTGREQARHVRRGKGLVQTQDLGHWSRACYQLRYRPCTKCTKLCVHLILNCRGVIHIRTLPTSWLWSISKRSACWIYVGLIGPICCRLCAL